MNKYYTLAAFLVPLLLLTLLPQPQVAGEEPTPVLKIRGAVQQELCLTLEDLDRFQSLSVQGNGVLHNGKFRGLFTYRGVPLQSLLRLAGVQKTEANFNKPVDMAVLAETQNGTQAALSWGEIFFQSQSPILVATSAQPILPKKDCSSCHEPATFKPRMQKYKRSIGFPKLVIPADTFADRNLEDLALLEVIQVPAPEGDRDRELFSESVSVKGDVQSPGTVKNMQDLQQQVVQAVHLGEGRGYHGIDTFSGYSFQQLLQSSGLEAGIKSVFLVQAPDGYQSLFSFGEVYLRSPGDSIILADQMNGQDLEKGGEYFLVAPIDKLADRWVKAVERITVFSLPERIDTFQQKSSSPQNDK